MLSVSTAYSTLTPTPTVAQRTQRSARHEAPLTCHMLFRQRIQNKRRPAHHAVSQLQFTLSRLGLVGCEALNPLDALRDMQQRSTARYKQREGCVNVRDAKPPALLQFTLMLWKIHVVQTVGVLVAVLVRIARLVSP